MKKFTKYLQFSQSSPQPQQPKHSGPQSSWKLSGKSSSTTTSSGSKTPSSSSRCRRGKKFWRFLASLSTAGGRCARAALGFVELLQSIGMHCGSPLVWVSHLIPPPPTCVSGTYRILMARDL